MKYYEQIENGIVTGYFSNSIAVNNENLREITQEEYSKAVIEMEEKLQQEAVYSNELRDKYIRELENENADLLYRLLTGEELTDA